MTGKIIVYLFVSILVMWSFDSVNINKIFKQGKVVQARLISFLLVLSTIYLVTNFIWDIFTAIKMI